MRSWASLVLYILNLCTFHIAEVTRYISLLVESKQRENPTLKCIIYGSSRFNGNAYTHTHKLAILTFVCCKIKQTYLYLFPLYQPKISKGSFDQLIIPSTSTLAWVPWLCSTSQPRSWTLRNLSNNGNQFRVEVNLKHPPTHVIE